MKKLLNWAAILLGLGFVVVTYMYWTTPAKSLPGYFPGFDPSLATVHIKHGIAALLLALACFSYAWFGTGKKHDSTVPMQ